MNWRFVASMMTSLMAVHAAVPTASPVPVNPSASPEARALLKYLSSISGKYILSGQHNYPANISRWSDRAYTFTGKYPAVFGQDFGFQGGEDKDSVEARPALIEEVKRQYRAGAIVTLTWHAVRPTQDEPVTFLESVQGKLTDYEWRELLTPGTKLHARWCGQVDEIAGYLRQLRDAHVPVLWRPYHEVNGGWFWWGGRRGKEGSAALYRQMYDRFVNVHHLDNLIWVWNANAPSNRPWLPGPFADFFPGLDVADVLSVDIYGSDYKQSHYDEIQALAAGKPIALGEVGTLPTLEILKAQPRWTWFMTWSEFIETGNDPELVKAVFGAPTILARGDRNVAEAMAAIRKATVESAPVPVMPGASPEARAHLAHLVAAIGKRTLLGQEEGATPSGRIPAFWHRELALPGKDDTAPLTQVQPAKTLLSLGWSPASPLGGGSTPLSDYEWNELLTPGSRLHQAWCIQVDAAAAVLKQLQAKGVSVLWQPYPQANAKTAWWAGRSGVRGSAALYRQLFQRLSEQHHLDNLLWVWSAAAPGPKAPGRAGDYFPGLLYVDALELVIDDAQPRWHRDADWALMGVGKPVGLRLTAKVPAPELLAQEPRWSWLTLPPPAPDQAEALVKLAADPRVE